MSQTELYLFCGKIPVDPDSSPFCSYNCLKERELSVVRNCIICKKKVSQELWPFCSVECRDYDQHMQEEYQKFVEYHESRIK